MLSIILSNPQMGENIGVSARSMKNFGFCDLRIINPRDGWPNEKALASSASARDIIENAQIYDSLENSIKDIHLLFATCGDQRNIDKPLIYLTEISKYISDFSLEQNFLNLNIAILFGRESSGLDNHEIARANYLINIPTNIDCPSMNLAQAVCIICYEFSKLYKNFSNNVLIDQSNIELTDNEQINHLANFALSKINISDDQNTHSKILNLFSKIKNLTKSDIGLLWKLIK